MRLQHFCRYHQFIQFSPFLYSIYVSPFIYSIICKSLRQLFILNNRLKIKLLLNVHTDWSWMSPRINWINDLNTIIYLKTLEWMNEQMNERMKEWMSERINGQINEKTGTQWRSYFQHMNKYWWPVFEWPLISYIHNVLLK